MNQRFSSNLTHPIPIRKRGRQEYKTETSKKAFKETFKEASLINKFLSQFMGKGIRDQI